LRGATIQDVARRAGVSATTISNYLNDRTGEMGVQTRERIAEAIRALGYVPSAAARQLKTGQSSMLGLLLPTVVNPFYGELAVAIDAAAQAAGFRVVLCNTQRDPVREAAFIDQLVSDGVRGIMAASVVADPRLVERHVARGVAFVLLEVPGRDPGVACVDLVAMDNVRAAALAVDHLVANGYRDIAYATATPLTPHRAERIEGYRGAMRRHGLGDGRVLTDEFLPHSSAAAGDARLADYGRALAGQIAAMQPRPSAVVAMNDAIGFGLLAGLHDLPLSVPNDIGVIAIDGTLLSRFSSPRLTTVRQPIEDMAAAAIECILGRWADRRRASRALILSPTLERGASVKDRAGAP
jgi:DNA-binding LacI/PurR family transcriptional regulator